MSISSIFPSLGKYFLVSGASEGKTRLNSFDNALLNAKIGNTNLLKMTSIIPPNAKKIELVPLPYGALVPVAYASITSDNPGEIISSVVGVAHPGDKTKPGLIMEYSKIGPVKRSSLEDIVKSMLSEGFSTRGYDIESVEFAHNIYRVKHIGTSISAVVLWD